MKSVFLLLSLFCIRPVLAAEHGAFTPLIEAVTKETNSAYAIETLISKGGRVNEKDEQGRTVLMLAATYHPDPAVVAYLIASGADVNEKKRDTGQTALFFAAQYNPNPQVVHTLLINGADRTVTDIFGRTADDYADRNPELKNNPIRQLLRQPQQTEEEEAPASSDSAISL